LNYHGLHIYSLTKEDKNNIYTVNEELWFDTEQWWDHISFGNDDRSYYCLNKDNGKYYIMDFGSRIINEYKTFDDLIIKTLKIILGVNDKCT
jgi:hypothetical protein